MSEQPKRTETVEEYIERGGTITRLPDSPNSFYGVELDTPTTVKPTSMLLKACLEPRLQTRWSLLQDQCSFRSQFRVQSAHD